MSISPNTYPALLSSLALGMCLAQVCLLPFQSQHRGSSRCSLHASFHAIPDGCYATTQQFICLGVHKDRAQLLSPTRFNTAPGTNLTETAVAVHPPTLYIFWSTHREPFHLREMLTPASQSPWRTTCHPSTPGLHDTPAPYHGVAALQGH